MHTPDNLFVRSKPSLYFFIIFEVYFFFCLVGAVPEVILRLLLPLPRTDPLAEMATSPRNLQRIIWVL